MTNPPVDTVPREFVKRSYVDVRESIAGEALRAAERKIHAVGCCVDDDFHVTSLSTHGTQMRLDAYLRSSLIPCPRVR